jgi:hypothetical protein
MEAKGTGTGSGPEGPAGGQPSEEEIRAALDEQMRQLRVEDLLLQSAASLVNLTARRIAKEDERDLQQAAIGIEAIRALAGLIPGDAGAQVRNALSELQVLYAREGDRSGEKAGGEAEGSEAAGEGAPSPEGGGASPPPQGGQRAPRGPAKGSEPPPRLWTPPGSS